MSKKSQRKSSGAGKRRGVQGAQAGPPEPRDAAGKEEGIVVTGEVTEALPNTSFRVTLETGQEVLAHLSGRLRRFRIRVNPGDQVQVELSPYDLTRGRITYRLS